MKTRRWGRLKGGKRRIHLFFQQKKWENAPCPFCGGRGGRAVAMPLSSSSRDTSQGLWEIFIFVPFIFRTSSIYSYFSLSLFSRHDHNNYDQVVSLLEGADEVKQLKKESLMLYQSTCRLICSGHCGTLQISRHFFFVTWLLILN